MKKTLSGYRSEPYRFHLIIVMIFAAAFFQGCISGGGFNTSGIPAPPAVTPNTTIAGYLSDDAVASPVLRAGAAASRAAVIVAEGRQYTVMTDSAGFFKADIQLSNAISPVIVKFQKKDSTLASGEYMIEKGGVYYFDALIEGGAGIKITGDRYHSFEKIMHPDELKVDMKKTLDERARTSSSVSIVKGRIVEGAGHANDKIASAGVIVTEEVPAIAVAGVSVSLAGAAGAASITDAAGRFSIPCDLKTGSYSLALKKAGYPERTVNFKVSAGDYAAGVIEIFAEMETGLKSIYLSKTGDSIMENSTYNLNSVKAYALYFDGSTREVGVRWTASEGSMSNMKFTPPAGRSGLFAVTASYTEGVKTASVIFTVSVNAMLTGLGLSEDSRPIESDSAFDLRGIRAVASYSGGATREVNVSWSSDRGAVSGYYYTPPAGYLGDAYLTASYSEAGVTKTAQLKLAISRFLRSIVLSPRSAEIAAGSVYKLAEVLSTAYYSDKTSRVVSSVWSFNGIAVDNQSVWLAPSYPQKLTLTANYTEGSTSVSDVMNFTVKPSISMLSAYSGVPGAKIAIIGKGFGTSRGESQVRFNQKYASALDFDSWSDTLISVKVPDGSTPGPLTVIVNQIASDGVNFETSMINSISPFYGTPGTSVTISGSGFGTAQGAGKLKFGTAQPIEATQIISWSNTKVIAVVPSGVISGEVFIELNGLRTNTVNFGLVSITSVDPAVVTAGGVVTIEGAGFGATQENRSVRIGSVTVSEIISWSAGRILFKVPSGAVGGPVTVVHQGGVSNSMNLSVFSVSSISPARGITGTFVTINGSGFGAAAGAVRFNGVLATDVVSWTDSKILVKVPSGAFGGALSLTSGPVTVTGPVFEVVGIYSVNPSVATAGDTVTVNGSGFGNFPYSAGQLKIGSAAVADILSWSDSEIRFKVPEKTAGGKISVTSGGVTATGGDLSIISISSLSQNYGPPGMPVTISGVGFGQAPASGNRLLFNGIAVADADVIEWSDLKITVRVPADSASGKGAFRFVSGAVYSNSAYFSVTALSSIEPETVTYGSQLILNGSGFGQLRGNGQVVIGSSLQLPIVFWSDSRIIANISPATPSGPVAVSISGVKSGSRTLKVIAVDSLSASRAAVNTQITVNGKGFGDIQGPSRITVNGIDAQVAGGLWKDGQIRIIVPSGAVSGPVRAVISGFETNAATLDVVRFSSVSPLFPAYGPPGTSVTINGGGFGSSRGAVSFNGMTASSIGEWKDDMIVASVPSGAVSGPVTVSVGGTELVDSSVQFKLSRIDAITPAAAPALSIVTITGEGFGSQSSDKFVKFKGVSAAAVISSWNDTRIEAVVPQGAVSGDVSVNIWGKDTNSKPFAVTP